MAKFLKSVAKSVSQIVESINENFEDVAIYTSLVFAEADIAIAGMDLDESDYEDWELPESIQKQAQEGLEGIRTKLAGKIQTVDEAIAGARDVAKYSEELSNQIKPALGLVSDCTSHTSISGSNLNATELLEESVRKCLQLLFSALIQQLDCCDQNHFVRLRLSGFINQFDFQSRSIFDLFLSSGHDCKRSHWVVSRCIFAKYVSCLRAQYVASPNHYLDHSPGENKKAANSSKSPCLRIRH
jgi:hypothetical protein